MCTRMSWLHSRKASNQIVAKLTCVPRFSAKLHDLGPNIRRAGVDGNVIEKDVEPRAWSCASGNVRRRRIVPVGEVKRLGAVREFVARFHHVTVNPGDNSPLQA